MAKYYVQSGRVQLILPARSPRAAAVAAFQWSCDRQATIQSRTPVEHLRTAQRHGWQLDDIITVSERGFGRRDAWVFDTCDAVAAWDQTPLPHTPSRSRRAQLTRGGRARLASGCTRKAGRPAPAAGAPRSTGHGRRRGSRTACRDRRRRRRAGEVERTAS